MVVWKQQSCWWVLWVPRGHEWASWKVKKPTAWHLMPHKKYLGKQGCNCQFRNHKIFNPCKTRAVNFCPSALFMSNCIQFYIIICCWFLTRCFLYCFVLVVDHSALLLWIRSASRRSLLFCSSNYSIFDYGVLFLSWYWKCVPDILIPINNNHLASQ